MPKSKPPRTNIGKLLTGGFGVKHPENENRKYAEELLLEWIEELVGEENVWVEGGNYTSEIVLERNSVRQEILEKAEEELK